MNSVIIFYSLEGNTRLIAQTIAQTIRGDIVELKPLKKYASKGFLKFFAGGKDVLLKKTPPLETYQLDLNHYQLLILGAPVWAGSYAPPLKTFFQQQLIEQKNIALFCCCSGSCGKTFDNIKAEMPQNNFVGEICLFDPLKKNRESQVEQAKKWIKNIQQNFQTKTEG
ncbi:MAG: flavodoxin family protein [bacterium]